MILGEEVLIKLKPYNSYCVDTLFIGYMGDAPEAEQKEIQMQWLTDRYMTMTGFDFLVKGQLVPRQHLPLIGQELEGEVISLVEDETGVATAVRIKSKCGQEIVADRSCVYVYCHWMGQADLAYCLQGGNIIAL